MQGLSTAKDCGHGFYRGAHHIVIGILLRQGPARGLAMGSQHQRFWILRIELFHDAPPQQTSSAQFRNLQVEVHANGKKEGQASSKAVDIQALG